MERLKLRRQVFASIICLSSLFSCIDYDGGFPVTDPIPVVNSMLNADSALSINITWSGNPGATSFTPINNAHVEVLENGVSIGSADSIGTDGTYFYNHTVKSSNTYDLSVVVDSTIYLSSKTSIPAISSFSAEWIGKASWGTEVFDLTIPKPANEVSAIYIFCYLPGNDGTFDNYGIYCASPLCDAFNRVNDTSGPDGFTFIYDEFIRIPADALLKEEIIRIASYKPVEIIVMEVTEEFDYYYKAAFWQGYYDPQYQLPFTWEAIHLPTNIKGGAGIFAGTTTTVFDVSEYTDNQIMIYGIVSDAQSKEALSGVAILNANNQNSYITDVNGYYSFDSSKGELQLEISCEGYQTKVIKQDFRSSTWLDIELEKITNES